MSWQTEISTIVRYLVDDTSTAPTYPDIRIETTILVAAQLVITEISFEQSYIVNVEQCQLTPDPTTSSARDDGFINIVALKAACIIAGSEYKVHALSSVKVSDGPSSIDMSSIADHMKTLYQTLLTRYEDYKINFSSNNSNVGQAVLGPYSLGNYGRNYDGRCSY